MSFLVSFLNENFFLGSSVGRAARCESYLLLENMKEKRTYRDRVEYLKLAVAKRRRKIKEFAVSCKGGRCEICGYSKSVWALDLHHRDPKTKHFGIAAKGYTRSWEAVRKEADKCVLVCANCHREIGAGITQLPDESPVEKQGELREA